MSEDGTPDGYLADDVTHKFIEKSKCNENNGYVYISGKLKRCIRDCSRTTDKKFKLEGECYSKCPEPYYGLSLND